MGTLAFSGIFFDEVGQRLLRISSTFVDNSLLDLHNKCLPSNTTKYRGALERISGWEKQIINDEYSKVKQQYTDIDDIFKQNFVSYVKSMRGGNVNTKIMVSIPNVSSFFHTFLSNIATCRSVSSGKYYTVGEFDRKVICMDCLRDTLYSYLNDEYVKLNTEKNQHEKNEYNTDKELSDDEDKWEVDSEIHPADSVSQINFNKYEEKIRKPVSTKIEEENKEETRENKEETRENKEETKSKVSDLSSIALSNVSKRKKAATEVSTSSSQKSVQKAKSLISFVSDSKRKSSVVNEKIPEKIPENNENVNRSASPGGRSYITQLTCNSEDD